MSSLNLNRCCSIPADYKPDVVISDEEFEKLYANKYNITMEQKMLARDYSLNFICRLLENSYKYDEMNSEPFSLTNVLLEFPTGKLESLFWGLRNCKCCWRHLHNTPVSLDSEENSYVLDVVTAEMIESCDCGCFCRMYKRFLRRAYFSEKHIPEDLPDLE